MVENSEAPAPESISTVTCPQCGGVCPLPAGEKILECPFCSVSLFVDRSAVVSHYWLPRLLDRAEAVAALRRWMAGNETVKDLDRRVEKVALEPVSFPMWLFRCRGKAGATVVVEPAAPTPIPQLADLEVPAGRLVASDPEGFGLAGPDPAGANPAAAQSADATQEESPGVEQVEATVPLETARQWLSDRQSGEVLETSLVRVPLWRARYHFAGNPYVALVDGSTGRVLASIFPEKAESPYVLVAVLGLLLFVAEGFLIGNPVVKLVAYGVTAVPLTLLAWWVARKV
jgi:hypothetical protein